MWSWNQISKSHKFKRYFHKPWIYIFFSRKNQANQAGGKNGVLLNLQRLQRDAIKIMQHVINNTDSIIKTLWVIAMRAIKIGTT